MTKAEEYCREYEKYSEGTENYCLFHEATAETNSEHYIIMEEIGSCEYYIFETWENAAEYIKEYVKELNLPQKTYTICIEETVNQYFKVDANTPEQAIEHATKCYKAGIYTLDDPYILEKHIAIIKPEEDMTDFIRIQ